MNQNADEVLIDLLIKQATEGLTDAERLQLNKLEASRHDNHCPQRAQRSAP